MKEYKKHKMKDALKLIAIIVMFILLVVMWAIILLNPIYFVIVKDDVTWILLYIAVIPECIVGAVITKILMAIMETID